MDTFDWLAKQALIRPDKTALIDLDTRREFSYLDFNRRASQFASYLLDELKLKPGERVAILAHNSTDYFEVLYGCAKAGVILVCLNWRLVANELEYIVADCSPTVLVYGEEFAEVAEAVTKAQGIQRTLCVGASPTDRQYEAALAEAARDNVIMPSRSLDDVWHLLYTSGTTGKPKGVIQTFGMTFFNAINVGLIMGLTHADSNLQVLPFFHTGGLNLFTNPMLHFGGTVAIMKNFDPALALSLLSGDDPKFQPNIFFAVPAVYLAMSQHPSFAKADLSHLRFLGCGGSPVPENLLIDYSEKGALICNGFGMTETSPTVFLNHPEYAMDRRLSVGHPVMHISVKIVDEQGNELPAGERGELWIKGPPVTPGYWQNEEKTREAFTADGWLKSGDVAYADEQGFYYIVDRTKDMFISGGENVYPAEVENVLFAMPGVADVAVIGVADDKWGEVGKAVVVLKPGAQVSVEDVIKYCKSQLAGYKVPKHVEFVNEMPRNASGKVQKQQLRTL